MIYTKNLEIDAACRALEVELADIDFLVTWRSGEVKESPTQPGLRRLRGSIPVGTKFCAIDLCRSNISKVHFARLKRCLPTILQACQAVPPLSSRQAMARILDLTASNGSPENFVRRLVFDADFLALCAKYKLTLRIDAVPCGED